MRQQRGETNNLKRAAWLACLAAACIPAAAQSASAVPVIEPQRFLGSWHVQAWIPSKPEKRCVRNVTVLFAAGDAKDSFQMGTFCQRMDNNTDEWDAAGKLDKTGGGKLKLRHWVIFSKPYWVLALDPEYRWVMIGTPNHKVLRILSKDATLPPDQFAEIESKARAQGFDPAKLVRPPQNPDTKSAGQVAP